MAKTTISVPKKPAPDGAIEMANSFFGKLMENPESVELGGYLQDVQRFHDKDATGSGLYHFGNTLQKHIEELKAHGLEKHAELVKGIHYDLCEIGTVLLAIKLLAYESATAGKVDIFAAGVEALAEKAGYLSDRTVRAVGGVEVCGSFDDWMNLCRKGGAA